jgi:hypothetical protein
MKEWYYSAMGQTKGPVSQHKLIDLILKQELELDSYVADGIDKPWKRIKDIPALLEELHKPADITHKEVFPADFADPNAPVRAGNLYFYIPIRRFILMSVLSLGLYQLYWMYKQWQYWDRKERKPYQRPHPNIGWFVFPFMIFRNIQYDQELNAVEKADFSGMAVFWLWLLAGAAIYIITGPLDKVLGDTSLITYLLGSLDVLVLVRIQSYINRVNARLGNSYDRPGFGHYACLLFGIGGYAVNLILLPIVKLLKG